MEVWGNTGKAGLHVASSSSTCLKGTPSSRSVLAALQNQKRKFKTPSLSTPKSEFWGSCYFFQSSQLIPGCSYSLSTTCSGFFLTQRQFWRPAAWESPGSLKNNDTCINPRVCDLIDWRCGLCLGIFQDSPGDPTVQVIWEPPA